MVEVKEEKNEDSTIVSKPQPVNQEVREGSVLEPVLFVLFTYGFPYYWERKRKMIR